MKKTTIILILGAFVLTNVYFKINDFHIPQTTRVSQATINDAQRELDRKKESKRLQDQIIIRDKINKIGILTTLEGTYKYNNKITDKGIFDLTIREMTLDFVYKFGMGINTEDIKATKVDGDTVYINIPKDKIKLQYIEINSESRIVDGKKMFLVSDFKPSDVEELLEESQYVVVGKINCDDKLFDEALVNLKSELEKLVGSMGFENVVFEVK